MDGSLAATDLTESGDRSGTFETRRTNIEDVRLSRRTGSDLRKLTTTYRAGRERLIEGMRMAGVPEG
jgi:hypothetical protein